MKTLLRLALALVATASLAHADVSIKRGDFVKRIESCEAILQEFMAKPETAIAPEVLQRATAIVVVNQFKAGFIIGVQHGYATVLVKRPNGTWSIPVLMRAGEASLGLQLGGKAVEAIYVFSDPETPKLLFEGRFNVGADAKAVAGPRAAEKEKWNRELLNTPIFVYVKSKGLFAGATVKAGYLSRDDSSNRTFYNTTYSMPELLYGDFVPPPAEVQPLMNYVKRLAP